MSEKICQETGRKIREKQIGAEIRESGSPHFQSQGPYCSLLNLYFMNTVNIKFGIRSELVHYKRYRKGCHMVILTKPIFSH